MSRKDFDTDEQYNLQLFKDLLEIVKELGWQVALPTVPDDEPVPGMVIGTQEYIDRMVKD